MPSPSLERVSRPPRLESALTQRFGVVAHPGFVRYLSARLIATLGSQIEGVAVGWQMYALTGRVLDLGLIGLAQFAPFLVLVLPAGHAADRYPRKRTIAACYAVQTLCSLWLLAFSLHPHGGAWPIFAVLAVQGAARAFIMPAQQAILMNIVPVAQFGQAVAFSSSSFHVAVILGPTLGGLLYLAGPITVYAIVSGLLATAFFLMLSVQVAPQQKIEGRWSRRNLLEGLSFVLSHPAVLGAISLDLFAVLLGGAVGVLPAYARDVLHTDSTGLGLLRTAPGIGAACTALVLALRPIQRNVGRWMFGGVAAFGVATLVLGVTENLGVAFAALFATGLGDMVSVYVRHLLVQLETPDSIRGRVSAVNSVFISASNELGTFESGLTAAWLGVLPAILIGGAATIVVTGVWARLFPVLSRLDEFPSPVLAEAGGAAPSVVEVSEPAPEGQVS
jgi:MFS family permease